jgi:hypothetical protein
VIITVNPLPTPDAGKPQYICSGTTIRLGDTGIAGHVYQWTSMPAGFHSALSDPVDSPKVNTQYQLKETISSTGCTDSSTVLMTVVPRPNAAFSVKNINGFEYRFTATNPNYPSWRYHWDFGDSVSGKADTISGYTVSHTYSKNGKYKVVLTIYLPGYCTEVDTYMVVINEQFSLNIYPNPFGVQTDISYTLTNPAHIRLSLTDELGKYIGTLLDNTLSQGAYNTYFDASLWKTRPAMYFVLFQIDDKLIVKKVIQLDAVYH